MLERQKRTLGVYFSCGMPWKRAAFVLLAGNALLFSHRRRGRRAVGRVQRKLAAAHDGGPAVQHSDGRRPCRRTVGRRSAFTIWKMRRLSPSGAHEKKTTRTDVGPCPAHTCPQQHKSGRRTRPPPAHCCGYACACCACGSNVSFPPSKPTVRAFAPFRLPSRNCSASLSSTWL